MKTVLNHGWHVIG